MHRRQLVLPPEYIYPVRDWEFVQKRFDVRFMPQNETVFALSNGYVGMRGTFEEGRPVDVNGTFVNAFYETWPITYGEEAYGFAKTGQTIVNVPDSKIIRLYVDDEPFFLPTANLLRFNRTLDMRAGTLQREVLWETPAGKQVLIKSTRLVSFAHRHLAAISYEVTVLNAAAPIVISSEIRNEQGEPDDDEDPRTTAGFAWRVLLPKVDYVKDHRALLAYVTANSGMSLACGIDHTIETECSYSCTSKSSEDAGEVLLTADAEPGKPIRITKYVDYHTSRSAIPEELCARAERTLDRAVSHGFEPLLAQQREFLDDFWSRSDVQIEGGHSRLQQCVRWNLFQLCQASARVEGAAIPAKGLTGQAYEGHYFWDVEIYVLPFLIYSSPRIAKTILKYRYSMLDKARQRAQEVNEKGALFPWRTINGEEASAYYAAGTAQYHINADIMHALRKYVTATGDEDFLYDCGAEMLVETARLWMNLGFYSDKDKRFHIHGVTGPDEYNTVVNNNTYTNLMARENFWYAAAVIRALQKDKPEQFNVLVDRIGLDASEADGWQAAADSMYLPYDEKDGVHSQDDGFLDREPWDFETTPAENYPLLLHYHPLVIYRHRVIKQADVVLAMFLLGNEFTLEEKQRNFDYYDPLTTGDSSLSTCIESIVASEIGRAEEALVHFAYAALMDLANVARNVKDGVHIASIGGTWMALVYGFAGMRDYDGNVTFKPRLPEPWTQLAFPLTIRGQLLDVDIRQTEATYLLREGSELTIWHHGEELHLAVGAPVTVKIQPPSDQ